MGLLRCPKCRKCLKFEDLFDGAEIHSRYEYTPGDWSQASGKLTAATADSPILFHNGAAKFFHVEVGFDFPNVGDHARLHFGGEEVYFERTGITMDVSFGGTTVTQGFGAVIGFFPRAKHPGFYGKFTTTPDTDLVGLYTSDILTPSATPPFLIAPGCLPNADYVDYLAKHNLGSGYATWGFSASAGASLTILRVAKGLEKCMTLGHQCCTACWPDGQPATATVTIAGFSGTVSGPFGDCDWSTRNGVHVIDRPTMPPACLYQKIFTTTGDGDCSDYEVRASYVLIDEANDLFQVFASIPSHVDLSPDVPFDWESPPTITREEICSGETFTLAPVGGGSTGGVTVTVAFA